MRTLPYLRTFCAIAVSLIFSVTAVAQNGRSTFEETKPIIFAVLYNGGTLEPIAFLENGKLVSAIDGGQDEPVLREFHSRFYKTNSSYPLIFGGASAGTVTVTKSDPSSECERHTAVVSVESSRAKLKGNVMAIATNLPLKLASGTRRVPTPKERAEIESLVRKEFAGQKVSSAALKNLKSQNLTALDVDNDGTVEMVGSYWTAPSPKKRALLFFIADRDGNSKYRINFKEYGTIDEQNTMSGDISSVDDGVLHELLLDTFDYDGDGTSEIFTYSPSFEGAGFNAYKRESGKWVRVFEGSNYRCGY